MSLAISTVEVPIMWGGVPNNATHKISVTGRVGNAVITALGTHESLPPGITIQQPAAGTNDAFLVGSPSVLPTSKEGYFVAFKATDDNGDSPPTVLHIKLAEAPDVSKIAVTLIADSRGGEPNIAYEKIGWKPYARRLLGDDLFQFYSTNVFFGWQTTTLRSKIPNFTTPIYNASRPMNIAHILGGHLNDLQSNPTITPAQVAQRYQDVVTDLQTIGFKAVASCAGAGKFLGIGSMDTNVRIPANEIIRGNVPLVEPSTYFSADGIEDMGSRAEFNSLPATANTTLYRDALHYAEATYRYFLIPDLVRTLSKISGFPLVAVFDLNQKYVVGEDIVPFSVIPTPFTGAKTWRWLVDGVQKSIVQNPSASDFVGLLPGLHKMRLEVTQAGITVFSEKSFVITSAGNVGGGLLSPEYTEIGYNAQVDLVASNITSPIFRKLQGQGVISNIAGNNARYTDGGDHSIGLVEAATEGWEAAPAGTTNANQEWDLTGDNQDRARNLKGRLNQPGDAVIYKMPANIAGSITPTGSQFRITEFGTGKGWRYHLAEKKFFDQNNDGNGWVERARFASSAPAGVVALNIPDLATNETVEFRRVLIGGGAQSYAVYIRGVYAFTFTATTSSGLYGINTIYDEAHTIWKRPDFRGDGVSNFAAGVSLIIPIAFPVPGFDVNTDVDNEIGAIENLIITDQSENCDSFEWRITNEFYTNALVASGANPTPNLTKYLRNGNNTIYQKGINSAGNATQSKTVIVVESLINVGNVLFKDFTGLSEGVVLEGSVEGIDSAGNSGGFSTTDEVTIT